MRFCYLFFIALSAFAQTAPGADEAGSIAGQVVRADSGEPLSRVMVTLRKVDARSGAPLAATTAVDGRFAIKGVAPGQYRLWANRNGFLTAEYGQKSYGKPGTPISVTATQHIQDVSLRMMQAGAISGRAVNEASERLAYVRVQALRQVFSQGRKQWMSAGMATTNDLGEYRIFGLAPGRYFLSAHYTSPYTNIQPTAQGAPKVDAASDESYAPLYYPGSFDPARASAIEVAAGADLRSIDFNLVPTRTVRVRGRVKWDGPETGQRPMVALIPRNATYLGYVGRHGAQVDEKGEFEIRGVTPGSYLLTADLFDQNNRQSARVPMELGSSSIDGINLMLAPLPSLQGRVRAEGDAPFKPANLRLFLQNADGGTGMGVGFATAKADGTFAVQNLAYDSYILNVMGLPDDFYIKSIKLGDIDLTEVPVDLSGGVSGSLDIVVAPGTSQLEGMVMKEQQPAPGAIVVLVPNGTRRTLGRFFRTGVADQNGRFVVKGITPGDYKAFAWNEIEDGVYQDPDFLQAFEGKGKSVSFQARAKETLQLEMLNSSEGRRD